MLTWYVLSVFLLEGLVPGTYEVFAYFSSDFFVDVLRSFFPFFFRSSLVAVRR